MSETVPDNKKVHYAWAVCAACLMVFFLSCGLGSNNIAMYYPFIRDQFAVSNTQISLLTTVRNAGNIVALAVVPAYYRKFNMRNGILYALCILILSFLLMAIAKGYMLFLAACFLAGAAYGLTCMVPLSMLIERWFVKDKVLAVSIICSGSGLATIGIPSLMTWVLKNFGIGATAWMEIGMVVLLGGIAVLLIRDCPGDKKTTAFGAAEEKGAPFNAKASAGASEKIAGNGNASGSEKASGSKAKVYSRIFKGKILRYLPVYLVGICAGLACSCGYNNVSLLMISVGHTVETAALGMSVAGVVVMTGKLLLGGICQKYGVLKPSLLFGVCWAAGFALICLSGQAPLAVLFTGCALFGMGTGMPMVCMVLWPKDWADGFEGDVMKQRAQIVYTTAALIFSPVPGITADLAGGSYVPVYIFFIILIILLLVLLIRNYRQAAQNA